MNQRFIHFPVLYLDDLFHNDVCAYKYSQQDKEYLLITDRAYLLFEGDILKAGSAEDLANDEQVRRVYLGQNFVLR